ncbi:MAG TPA: triose-phosphate isomerase [Candidatus Dormibacteraeota bacterium]|nr:triose-phosphate isomerase [Candidatus Dormibacteraeota bacterium]
MISPARRPLVAGNWKMHTTVPEALNLTTLIRQRLDAQPPADVVLLPPFTSVWPMQQLLAGDPRIAVGAQDCYWDTAGAFTGQISADMLRESCQHVLVGHSERRHLFGDTNEVVRRKLDAVLAAQLTPLLAVGETAEERSSGRTAAVLREQVISGLGGLAPAVLRGGSLAYEPVWAIGAGKTADLEDIATVIAQIRGVLDELDSGAGIEVRVLYGGSVTPESAPSILGLMEVDGALVGGASLDPEEFCAIVAAAGTNAN